MKVVFYEKYGPPEVLEQREIEKPAPKDHQVLIKVNATTVNATDCNARGLSYVPPGLGFLARLMMGIRKPRISILGSALAGEIEAVGAEVTGVCSTPNMELVRSQGAHKVIDYTKEDFTQNGERYDFIFDVVVGKTSFSRCRNSLKTKGSYLAVAGGKKVFVGGGEACDKLENLIFLRELVEKGELTAVIDRTYPLDEIVEAHRHVERGSKQGNVVVTV